MVPDLSTVAALFVCSGRPSNTVSHHGRFISSAVFLPFFGDWLRSLWSRLHSLQQRVGLVFTEMSAMNLGVSQDIA